jgi:alkanesulfonate monooxygenase SsuD/methylene tetrahydromethanopterin reductase-like flavin-dependent oxidoreductase (luciferase family)
MFLAGLVPQTKNLTFGTAVINLPNHHPAIVAGEVAQFDHMSGGRFMLGVGPGGLASDHELFEVGDGAKRGRMFVEAIDHMIKIWASDPPYDIEGEFWNIRIKKAIVPELGFGTMPKPLQQPHPPIHISIGSPDSSSARMAASRGWGIISGPNAPTYSIASHWKAYAETCAAAGRPARGENWRVARNVIVAPTDAEAEERVFGAATANRYFFTYLRTAVAKAGRLGTIKPRPDMSDEEFTPDVLMAECAIYGSPKTVLEKLIAFRDRVGPFGTVLKMGVDWGGPSEAWEREAMTLLAHDVMPKFRQHVAAQPQAAE